MQALIAMVSCHSRRPLANVQRKLWVPLVPAGMDVIFFLGRGEGEPLSDEVFLDCRDDYFGLPEKVQCIIRWAYDHGYDYVFKCDDDVLIKPTEFLQSGFENHDYVGKKNHSMFFSEAIRQGLICRERFSAKSEENIYVVPWGFLYGLSRRAMKRVAYAPLPLNNRNDEAWVASVLYTQGFLLYDNDRMFLHRGLPSEPAHRPLRAPKRPRSTQVGPSKETYAYCIYIDGGTHSVALGVIAEELKKFFNEYCAEGPDVFDRRENSKGKYREEDSKR